jgi:hypothetical protein
MHGKMFYENISGNRLGGKGENGENEPGLFHPPAKNKGSERRLLLSEPRTKRGKQG